MSDNEYLEAITEGRKNTYAFITAVNGTQKVDDGIVWITIEDQPEPTYGYFVPSAVSFASLTVNVRVQVEQRRDGKWWLVGVGDNSDTNLGNSGIPFAIQAHDHTTANQGGDLGANTVGTTQITDSSVTVAKLALDDTLTPDTDNAYDVGSSIAKWREMFGYALTLEERTAPGTPASGDLVVYAKSDGLYYKDDAGTETGPLTGGASGANTALSNLASVAVNESLISDTDNTDDLGSSAIKWQDTYTYDLHLDEQASITTPASGDVAVAAKTDGQVYSVDDTGREWGPFGNTRTLYVHTAQTSTTSGTLASALNGGAISIPANTLQAGTIIRISGHGDYDNFTPGSFVVEISFGGNNIRIFQAENDVFTFHYLATIYTTGVSGNIHYILQGFDNTGVDDAGTSTSAETINTTVSNDLDVLFSESSSGTLYINQVLIEIIG